MPKSRKRGKVSPVKARQHCSICLPRSRNQSTAGQCSTPSITPSPPTLQEAASASAPSSPPLPPSSPLPSFSTPITRNQFRIPHHRPNSKFKIQNSKFKTLPHPHHPQPIPNSEFRYSSSPSQLKIQNSKFKTLPHPHHPQPIPNSEQFSIHNLVMTILFGQCHKCFISPDFLIGGRNHDWLAGLD